MTREVFVPELSWREMAEFARGRPAPAWARHPDLPDLPVVRLDARAVRGGWLMTVEYAVAD